ncbi:MAG: hypothetical protein H6712_29600 [Myxococcales bacterium]|nr:hypothetical protein [Myxococcales bacterium]MCB9718042.1 hypothetical protein [Myxococcales bacterium]
MSTVIGSELEELERQGYGRDEPDLGDLQERPARGRTARGRPRRRRARPAADPWEQGCEDWYRQLRVMRAEYG